MASGNYRADHVGGVIPVPGSAGEFTDDPVAGAVDAQLKAVMDVFTDGAAVHSAQDAVSSAAALRERAPSWAKLKVTLPAPSETLVACANDLFANDVAYVQFDYSDTLDAAAVASDGELLTALQAPEGCTTGLYLSAAPLAADEKLAEAVFALPIARFLIVFGEDPDELSILRSMPEDRFAVLGIVDSDAAELEDPEPLLEFIDAAAAIHGDLLAVCPTRGFEASNGTSAVHQQGKLELVSDVSRMFWGTEL